MNKQAEGYNPCDDQTSTASPESSTTGDGSGLSSATIGRSPFMFCPNDNPQMRETPGGPKHTRLPPQQAFNMNMSSTSNETSPSNSVEMPECSGLTPASSVEHGSPQQSTPLTQSSNSFSPIDDSMGDQMGLPYQGITPGQRTGFTPMPDNTLSPGKEMPWAMLDFDNNNPEMTGGMNLFDLFQGGSYQ